MKINDYNNIYDYSLNFGLVFFFDKKVQRSIVWKCNYNMQCSDSYKLITNNNKNMFF